MENVKRKKLNVKKTNKKEMMTNANRNVKKARMINVSPKMIQNHQPGDNVKTTKNYQMTRKHVKIVLNTVRNLVMVSYVWVNCAIKDKCSQKMVNASSVLHICVVKINTLVDLTFAKMENNSEKMVHVVHVKNSTGCQLTASNASKTNVMKDNSFKMMEPVSIVKHS